MPSKFLTQFRNTFFVVIAMAGVACIAYLWSHHQGVENLRQVADTRFRVVGANLVTPEDKYSYLPGMLARHPQTINTLLHKRDAEQVQAGNRFLQQLNDESKLAVIYLLDMDGVAVAASNWQEQQAFIGHNFSFRPYFQEALVDGSGSFYAMGTISLLPGYFLSNIVRKDGVALGVLVIKVNIDNLDRLADLGQAEVMVTDENGIAFLSTRNDWKYRPIAPLTAEAEKEVRSTRQYENVLKAPLPATVEQSVGPYERIVSVRQMVEQNASEEDVQYLARSGPFPGSSWMVHIFVPMKQVNLVAIRIAVLAFVMAGLLVLALMYLMEVRSRLKERERSRIALQTAHQALEQKHGELETLSENLRIVSMTDSLTGAHNRRYFLEMAGKLAAAVNQADYALSVMMIDVDYFKRINDVYGHPTGDKVLQLLTSVCKDVLRSDDVFARFGGEEFIMAFPDTDEHAARKIGERLRTNIMARPFEVNGQIFSVTVSCGISRYRFTETGMDETIKRADEALYEAKSNGRNQVVLRV
jgi:two-component system C4-dicarboxylate transport sensor histidine kinase DctB